MKVVSKLWVFLSMVLFVVVSAKDDYCNVCLDGQFHKSEPGPESELYSKCSPWKSRSCCTNDTAYSAHQGGPDNLYAFTYSHCPDNPMSAKCRERFQENNCFYECSPNVGPWIVTEPNAYRSERFRQVPLDATVCEAWYQDCKDDYTCKDNWSYGWDWTSGTNKCPADSSCQKFSNFFPNATSMCEKIYPDDFKVVQDDKPGMVLWFGTDENPNDKVSQYYADEKGYRCGSTTISSNLLYICSLIFAVNLFVYL